MCQNHNVLMHCALCCFIIMNVKIHMYFVNKSEFFSKLHEQKVIIF